MLFIGVQLALFPPPLWGQQPTVSSVFDFHPTRHFVGLKF